jgi:hypothetical protein
MKVLESVGCVFNVETITVYPWCVDGTCDENYGTNVADCSDEWWSRLSPRDLVTVVTSTNAYYGVG